jgi:phage-related minor tail protein
MSSDAEARSRGFFRSVLAAMAGQLLSSGVSRSTHRWGGCSGAGGSGRSGFPRTGDRWLLAQALLKTEITGGKP